MELHEFKNDESLDAFYQHNFPKIEKMVLVNSGTTDQAHDLMQDAIIILLKNLKSPDFKLTAKLETYFFGIAKRMWLYKLRGRKGVTALDETIHSSELEQTEDAVKQERIAFIKKGLEQLGKECREVITRFYFWKMPFDEIESIMGYAQGYGRVKKSRCMNDLKKILGK